MVRDVINPDFVVTHFSSLVWTFFPVAEIRIELLDFVLHYLSNPRKKKKRLNSC